MVPFWRQALRRYPYLLVVSVSSAGQTAFSLVAFVFPWQRVVWWANVAVWLKSMHCTDQARSKTVVSRDRLPTNAVAVVLSRPVFAQEDADVVHPFLVPMARTFSKTISDDGQAKENRRSKNRRLLPTEEGAPIMISIRLKIWINPKSHIGR